MGKKAMKAKTRRKAGEDANDEDVETTVSAEATAEAIAERLRFDFSAEEAGNAVPVTTAERMEMLQALSQLREKLAGLRKGACAALLSKVEGTSQTLKAQGGPPGDGPAVYIEMRGQLLLSYIVALSYYLVLKVKGVPVKEHPVVPRLLWIRTLLEKLKPVDQRLQYQMSKLLQWNEARKAESQGDVADARALRPGQLAASVDDDEEDEDEEAEEPAAAASDATLGAYRPPRISQVEYTGDHVSMQDRAEKELERKKARLERSEFMRSLREEFTDAPKEVMGELRSQRAEKTARMMSEQQEYEEDTMTRLRVKKAEVRKQRQALREGRATSGGAVSLYDATADFNDIARSAGSGLGGGKGKGKGKRRGGGGGVLQEYHEAKRKVHGVRESVASALDGAPKGKRGRSGGGKAKMSKKSRH